MTKHLNALAHNLQRRLMSCAWPPPATERVALDAWTCLERWNAAGQPVYRVRDGERSPPLSPDLDLAGAPARAVGQCYVLDREHWIIIARVVANEPVPVHAPDRVIAYAQPLLLYCTEHTDGALASGHINLLDQPTPTHLRVLPGTSLGELHATPLASDEIAPEMIRLAQVLPFFYEMP